MTARRVAVMVVTLLALAGCDIQQEGSIVIAGGSAAPSTDAIQPSTAEPTPGPSVEPEPSIGDDPSSASPSDPASSEPTSAETTPTATTPVPTASSTSSPTTTPTPTPTATQNRPPAAQDDSASTDEDTSTEIDVLANDADPDGDDLTVTITRAPSEGRARVLADNRILYVPAADDTGFDTLTYRVSDGQSSDTAVVRVTIRAVNDAPQATDDAATVLEDSSVLIDVLANDDDVDGDSLAISSVGGASRGSASIQNGRVRYAPAPNATGTDTLTYTVSDPDGATDQGTVNITIEPVNDAPTASGDGPFIVQRFGSLTLTSLLDNDSDPEGDSLSIEIVSQPQYGTVSLVDDRTVSYRHGGGSAADDAFTYRVRDSGGAVSGAATVTLRINRAPIARDDSNSVGTGFSETTMTFNVITGQWGSGCCQNNWNPGYDTDADGDTLRLTSSGGSCSSSGWCTVTLPACSSGTRTFDYTISDGRGGSSTATVTVDYYYACID